MRPRSPALEAVLAEATRRASARGQALSTLDVLHALLEHDAPRRVAGALSLKSAGLAPDEPAGMPARLLAEAARLAARCGSEATEALHALAVLCRDTQSAAYAALAAGGHDPTRIRAAALRELTAPRPRRRRQAGGAGRDHDTPPGLGLPRHRPSALMDALGLTEAPPDRPAPQPPEPAARAASTPASTLASTPAVRDLVAAARAGQLEPLVGRTRELDLLADVLGKRRGALACVVGEPGTGKTALVHGLAQLCAARPGSVPALRDADLLAVDLAASPAQVTSSRPFVLFYDGVPDAAVMPALAASGTSAIVALSPTDLRRLYESTPALGGRLTPVLLAETSPDQTLAILRAVQAGYARHHRVVYQPAALETAARLAPRYVCERFLPDKALALLDLAGARARRMGRARIGPDEVAELVAESAGVPVDRLLARDAGRLLRMEQHLSEWVVGHKAVLARIAAVVRRNYAGFRAHRPVGSFLFLGPTGVGKTETAKALAGFLMGSANAMVRLDMSEYMESHSVARLIGSPPGYVGYEDGGQLTEAVRRRPDTVVLLDEIEKAHRDVLPILLQILDEGRLTDGRGRTVDFSNTIIVMTSNLGAGARRPAEVLAAARRAFPIELWNRIEEPLVFAALGPGQVAEVARRLAQASSRRLERERGIRFELDDAAVSYLLKHGGFDRQLGARPMRAALGRLVEAPLAEAILAGQVQPGQAVRVAVGGHGRRLVFARD